MITEEEATKLPKTFMFRCEICGVKVLIQRYLYVRGQRTCSHRCALERRRRRVWVTLKCQECATPFQRRRSAIKLTQKHHFCQPSCYHTWRNRESVSPQEAKARRNEYAYRRYHDPEDDYGDRMRAHARKSYYRRRERAAQQMALGLDITSQQDGSDV